MDDPGQGDESSPIVLSDGEEEAPASIASESPMFMEQDDDDDAPAESAGPESVSPARESSMSSNQPGATMSPNADDAESSQLDDDSEEEVQAEPKRPEGAHSPENEPARGQREDAGGNGKAEMEYNDSSSDDAEPCTRACLKQAKSAARKLENANKRINAKNQTIDYLQQQLDAANSEIRGLKEELKRFTGSENPGREPSWEEKLQDCLVNGSSYQEAWKSSYRALNMPIDPNMCHPQVRFVMKDGDESISSRESSLNDLESVRSDEEIRSTKPLPDNVLYKILTELLTKDGLVHCFSRLDPHCEPVEFPSRQGLSSSSTGIRGRFFISSEQRSYLSLTWDTEDPKKVLAALCVSRKFAFYGIHIFYGSNTFAWSSLGELDRFATGIGPARWQRIQNVELTWVGGKCVKFNLGKRSGERLNRRTSPLAWFMEAASLKTLCIHVRESHKGVIRRRHEPHDQKVYMAGKTAGQPNFRMTRSMRGLMGIDNIYQLRGLYWTHIYDLDKEIADPERSVAKIRDQSFVIDIERVVTQEKVPSRFEKSKLENLDPLFPVGSSWRPSRQEFDRIRPIYTEDTGYDNRLNDLDYDATSSQGTIESVSSDDGEDGSDDDEDDDSSGPSLHSPPGPSRRRRPFTPAPSPGVAEEEELSESEGDLPDESQRSNLRRTRSEGGSISRVSSEIIRARQPVIVIEEDDDIVEMQAPTTGRSSARQPSRLSMFVTPGPNEPRTSGTPGRRSTSALQARRASSAPHVDASSPHISNSYIDLTAEDSDEEAENENKNENENVASETGEDKEEGSVPAKDDDLNGAIEAADGVPALFNPGTKRARLTSPASEGGGDTKRQKPSEYRTGSLPLILAQTWSF
ncbi:hypothetical protein INS49_009732 [Diaporthe citri]|uniref:uncharacterized protein n=1 Tax=Diaporthe citri TaxID=83186 RepID=UPI001C7FE6E5|nr:uncharacterized protein INS49_009732 [Diaporthe citri]KAG6361505.1 hypothetical protein INS49_009732 [Diaporthe citri]